MTADTDARRADRLNAALAALYCGPLEDFVRARDALAKELRSGGDRDAATAVKAMRKPSRLAWALNAAVRNEAAALAGLEDAVALTLQAQAGGGDVRAAMGALRAAVRDLARAGEEAARSAGQSIDATVLSSAVLAVLGMPDSFDRLRHGLLTDIPEAGGLDFLAGLPAPMRTQQPAPVDEAAESQNEVVPEPQRSMEARARAARAAEARTAAAAAATEAIERQRQAERELAAAQAGVRQAQADLAAAEQRHELARRGAEAAAAALRRAEADDIEAQRAQRPASR